jgi:hypothetical protein
MCFFNCSRQKVINGIVVSELLLIVSKERHINYCQLLNEATKGNVTSIKQLALLEIYDGVGYDHGGVIVDLIELIGEDKFIQSLAAITNEQKRNVKSYIEAGLEYGNNLQSKTFKKAFPKTYDFLN